MDKNVKEQLKFQISEINQLFKEYDLIFQKIKYKEPDIFDMTVLGSVLHSFYNGLEKVFEIVAKNIDKSVPSGSKSHQELLHQMASENSYRDEIIDEKLFLKLREYATFRHFYRHAYSFQLNWDKMKYLVEDVYDVWKEVEEKFRKLLV